LVFIKKNLHISSTYAFDSIEAIFFKIVNNGISYNFIYCYRNPSEDSYIFLNKIDTFIVTLNLEEHIFVVGDLNINLLTNKDNLLTNFIKSYNLKNLVKSPTHEASKIFKKSNKIKISQTLIDVVLHNNNLINSCITCDCSFSDHKYVLFNIFFDSVNDSITHPKILTRSLNSQKLQIINNKLDEINMKNLFEVNSNINNIIDDWNLFKANIITIMDEVTPKKNTNYKVKINWPVWFDHELLELKKKRDSLYKIMKKNPECIITRSNFIAQKKIFEYSQNYKLIVYFQNKTSNDFKNTKKFFDFYSNYYKMKSDKSNLIQTKSLTWNEINADRPSDIANLFNKYFTSISSISSDTKTTIDLYINNCFPTFVPSGIANSQKFSFNYVTNSKVAELMSTMSSYSGAGVTDIPSKLLKDNIDNL
jgi:hypothetical protein